jgi:hypothetical protein
MTDVKSCQRYISHKVQLRLFDWMVGVQFYLSAF